MLSFRHVAEDTLLIFDDRKLLFIVEATLKGYMTTVFPSGYRIGSDYASHQEALNDINSLMRMISE